MTCSEKCIEHWLEENYKNLGISDLKRLKKGIFTNVDYRVMLGEKFNHVFKDCMFKDVFVELEFKASNFRYHNHSIITDIILCIKNDVGNYLNYKDKNIPVVSLRECVCYDCNELKQVIKR